MFRVIQKKHREDLRKELEVRKLLPLLYPIEHADPKKKGKPFGWTDMKAALAAHEKGTRTLDQEYDPKFFQPISDAEFSMV